MFDDYYYMDKAYKEALKALQEAYDELVNVASLKEVIETYAPDRILIEPSGVGKLSDIVNAILELKEEVSINILFFSKLKLLKDLNF